MVVNGVVVDNNIVSFTQGLAKQDQNDILDMLAYADFFATQAYRKQEHWLSWINYYRSQLVSAGCKLTSPLVKEPVVIQNAHELDTLGFGFKGVTHAGNLVALALRSLKAARINEYASHFFQYGSGPGFRNRFQILPCEEVVGTDDIQILLCGVHAKATASSGVVGGDWRVSREMVISVGGGLFAFNRLAYAQHRERIRTRLTEVRRFNIQSILI